jgi:hypothetical protein
MAVLSFNLISIESGVPYRWNCTEVFGLQKDGKWQLIHSHWSQTRPVTKCNSLFKRHIAASIKHLLIKRFSMYNTASCRFQLGRNELLLTFSKQFWNMFLIVSFVMHTETLLTPPV